jgi:hypothetical protein
MTVVKRESAVMGEILFRFMKQVVSLAQKRSDAAVMQLSHPAGNASDSPMDQSVARGRSRRIIIGLLHPILVLTLSSYSRISIESGKFWVYVP